MTFREKSLWVSLLISAVIASLYGDSVYYYLFVSTQSSGQDIAALITRLAIAIVVLEVLLHIALAMKDQEGAGEPEDERENSFRLRANDTGYWVLSIGVIACILHQMFLSTFDVQESSQSDAFVLAPIELKLVVVFWLSEIVRFTTELYLHNKEA